MKNSITKKEEPINEKVDPIPQDTDSQKQSSSPNVAASVKRRLEIEFNETLKKSKE
jgi:hypothetical protein